MTIHNIRPTVILFIFLIGSAFAGIISISRESLESGSVKIDVSFRKTKNVGILIRVVPISSSDGTDTAACDPHAAIRPGLDVRDASDLVTNLQAPMVIGGVWKVRDDDSSRKFSAILSPAVLRQHFSSSSGYGAVAVSGGSVAARVRACAYEIVPKTGDMTSILDAAHEDVISKDGASPGKVDMTAVVVSVTPEGDDRVSVVVETHAASTEFVGVARRGLSALAPVAQVVPANGASVNCGARVCSAKVEPTGKRSRVSDGGIRKVSSWCSSTGTDKNGATECVQRWTVSVGRSDMVSERPKTVSKSLSPAPMSFVDAVLSLLASPIVEKEGSRNVQFSLHIRAPLPEDTAAVSRDIAGKSSTARIAAVVRAEGMSEQRVNVQKYGVRAAPTKATLIDSTRTCVDLSVEGFSGAGTVIDIVDASMIVCEDGIETCAKRLVLPMVRNGRASVDFAKNVRGRMSKTPDGTRLCYIPGANHQGTISVKWEATAPGARKTTTTTAVAIRSNTGWNDKADRVHHHEPEVHHHHPPHPEWCEHGWGCNGTFDIDAIVTCRHGEVYDDTFGDCMSDSDRGAGSYIVAVVAALFALVLIGTIMMMFLSAWGYW